MGRQNGSRPFAAQAPQPALDPGAHAALSELHARVLVLDAEWRRLGEWLEETRRTGEYTEGRGARNRRYLELSRELDALRAKIAALRRRIDPEGTML